MIVLHVDDKGAQRVAALIGDEKDHLITLDVSDASRLDTDALADWIASNNDPQTIVVKSISGQGTAQSDAFDTLRRLAKINGVDVHLIGDNSLSNIADAIVRNDAEMEELNADSAVGKKVVELLKSEEMTEFERAEMDIPTVDEVMKSQGMPRLAAEEHIAWMKSQAVWVNNLYQVNIEFLPGSRAHLMIRRLDKQPVHNWQHFQQIKNRFLGPECEAVEVYPKESNLVDAKHHYHLWGFSTPKESFGIGFTGRNVTADGG